MGGGEHTFVFFPLNRRFFPQCFFCCIIIFFAKTRPFKNAFFSARRLGCSALLPAKKKLVRKRKRFFFSSTKKQKHVFFKPNPGRGASAETLVRPFCLGCADCLGDQVLSGDKPEFTTRHKAIVSHFLQAAGLAVQNNVGMGGRQRPADRSGGPITNQWVTC